MGRTILFVIVLVVAFAIPYLLHHTSQLVNATGQQGESSLLTRLIGGSSSESEETALENRLTNLDEKLGSSLDTPSPTGPPGLSIADLLRFDATKVWIQQNWKAVTSELPAYPLYGYRVPVMTGTEPHDIAGSLTYYFNSSQRVERITLHGFTSDYSALATLVQQRFGLTQYAAIGPATFLAFHGQNPISMMRVQVGPAPSTDPGAVTLFEVDLELNLPKEGAMLSADKLMELFEMQQADVI